MGGGPATFAPARPVSRVESVGGTHAPVAWCQIRLSDPFPRRNYLVWCTIYLVRSMGSSAITVAVRLTARFGARNPADP